MTFIVGEAQIDKETEEKRFPNDRAVGVGILLSQVTQTKERVTEQVNTLPW